MSTISSARDLALAVKLRKALLNHLRGVPSRRKRVTSDANVTGIQECELAPF